MFGKPIWCCLSHWDFSTSKSNRDKLNRSSIQCSEKTTMIRNAPSDNVCKPLSQLMIIRKPWVVNPTEVGTGVAWYSLSLDSRRKAGGGRQQSQRNPHYCVLLYREVPFGNRWFMGNLRIKVTCSDLQMTGWNIVYMWALYTARIDGNLKEDATIQQV